MVNDLSIQLGYKLKIDDSWHEKNLSATEYFDLETGEKPALDSVPQYMHAAEYLDDLPSDIEFTIVTIADGDTSDQFEIRETFWSDGRNRIIERTDRSGGKLIFSEVIVQVEHANAEIESIKFERKDRFNKLIFHSIDND